MADLPHATILCIDIAGTPAGLGKVEAARRVVALAVMLCADIRMCHGTVIEPDSGHLLGLFRRDADGPADAARAAIQAQQIARKSGMSLHTGMHTGHVAVLDVAGRTDVSGMAVHFASGLHALAPKSPGNIFLSVDTARLLPAELRERIRPYGHRTLDGVGDAQVCTLGWDDAAPANPKRYEISSTPKARPSGHSLVLRHAGAARALAAADPSLIVGRSASHCGLVVDDPLVSGRHLKFVHRNGRWHVKDASRNGTWLRDEATGDVTHVHRGAAPLPAAGALCLGRPFGSATAPRCTVAFVVAES